MANVDLNPIRAKMAVSVSSEYTSAYEHLLPCKKSGIAQQQEKSSDLYDKKPLFGFIGDEFKMIRRVFHFHYSITVLIMGIGLCLMI